MNKTLIQILKNLVSSWCVVGLQAGIGLYMVPFLLGHLGRDGYGAVAILTSIIGFAEIADLGLRSALNRELSEKVAIKDVEGFRQLSSSALVLYVWIALCVSVFVGLFAPALCSLFKVGDAYQGTMTLLLRTYAPLSVLLSFVTPVFTAGICSYMRYDIQNNVSMIGKLFASLMLFVCLSFIKYDPLLVWSGAQITGALLRFGLMVLNYRKICGGGGLGLRYVNRKSLTPLFQLGSSMYILQLTRILAQRMDPFILSRFIGLGGVALYQAGSRLPQMVSPIVMAAMNQLTPLTTKYHVTDNQVREQQVLLLGTKYTLYLGAFFSVAMILFADSFCQLWLFDSLGDDVKVVALVMKMWAVANFVNYSGGPHWPILLGKKKVGFAVWLNIPTAIFNIVLSVFLVANTRLGVAGVLVGTIISECIRRPVAILYISRLLDLSVCRYLVQAYIPPVLYAIIVFLTGDWLISQLFDLSWFWLVVFVSGYSLVALMVFVLFEQRMVRAGSKRYLRVWGHAE